MTVGEGTPERALAAAQPPAGLIHVHSGRGADPLEQIRARLGQRVGGTLQDRVDRPGRDSRGKQLLAQLDGVTARDPVADRERDDGRLQARPERALGNPGQQRAGAPSTAARTRDALAAVLDHAHGHHRQLLDLMARRLTDRDPIGLAEHVPASAPLGPVLDDLVDHPRRQQRPALTLMPRLGAPRTGPTDPSRAVTHWANHRSAAATSSVMSAPARAQASRSARPGEPPSPSAARPAPQAARSAPTAPATPTRPRRGPPS